MQALRLIAPDAVKRPGAARYIRFGVRTLAGAFVRPIAA
jgi:hypothetical protein